VVMSQQWQFEMDEQAKWHWRRVDDAQVEVESPASFSKPIECIIDAVRYAVQRRRSASDSNMSDVMQ